MTFEEQQETTILSKTTSAETSNLVGEFQAPPSTVTDHEKTKSNRECSELITLHAQRAGKVIFENTVTVRSRKWIYRLFAGMSIWVMSTIRVYISGLIRFTLILHRQY
jgi:hypothetical protein